MISAIILRNTVEFCNVITNLYFSQNFFYINNRIKQKYLITTFIFIDRTNNNYIKKIINFELNNFNTSKNISKSKIILYNILKINSKDL